jgi:hypothetical protein
VELLQDRQARLRLVALIEHARGAEAAAKGEQETQAEEIPSPSPSLATPNPSGVAATPARPVNALASKDGKESEIWLWVGAAIATVLAAATLLVMRLRKKNVGSQ